jgi:hypothetical protein
MNTNRTGRIGRALIAGWSLLAALPLAADSRSGGSVSITAEVYDAGGTRTTGGAIVNDGSVGGVGNHASGGGFTMDGGYPAQIPAPTPPTATALTSFEARWIGADEVALEWRTGVEFDLLGFRLQRQGPGTDWLAVNADLIPAAGDAQPHRYGFVEAGVPGAGETRYRLVEVDLSGQTHVVGETMAQVGPQAAIAFTPSGLTISLRGQAGPAVVETAADVAHGPWQPLTELRLDAAGQAVLQVPLAEAGFARFYRVRQE